MSGHSSSHYFKIYFALVILFLISWVVPEVSENKIIILLSAFGIAAVKAYMVVAYFMHLNIEKKFVLYMLITTLAFMYLLFVVLTADIKQKKGHNWKSNIVVEVPEGHGHHDDHVDKDTHRNEEKH